MSNVGEMQIFRQKAASSEVIQFTGKNGNDVVEFINDRVGVKARNGGSYVSVVRDCGDKVTIKKGEFVCWSGSEIVIHDEEALRATHVINKTHALL